MKWRQQAYSSQESLRSLRFEALQTLTGWGLRSEDDKFDLEVILCELLSNAAKHGNRWQENRSVKVNMRYFPAIKTVLLLVCDEGQKDIEIREPELLSEEGRGLQLVEALCSRLKTGRGRVWVRKELTCEEKDLSC